jgi:hypothetical protein
VVFPPELDTPEFHTAWDEWVVYCAEIKKGLTPKTAEAQLKDLARWGVDVATQAIEESIRNGYRKLVLPTNDRGSNNGTARKRTKRTSARYQGP